MSCRVPCAFQDFLRKFEGQLSFTQLSLSQRQLAFEHWFAYNSTTICKAISHKGDFVCPMLPCLEHFKNLESCLQHLSHCPSLAGASYWCPFCWDKESLEAAGQSLDDHLRNLDSRKSSRFKRAAGQLLKRVPVIAFVKRFGRVSDMARSISEASSTGIAYDPENQGLHMLPTTRSSRLIEELAGQSHQPSELSERRQSTGRWSTQSSKNDAPQVGSIEGFNREMSSRFSYSNSLNITTRSLPLIKIPNLLSPFSKIDSNPLGKPLTTTENLYQVLRENVNHLNKDWMRQLPLRHVPDVWFSLSDPFEQGIQSLQGFFERKLPQTFQQTFALMHIVHACASIYHDEHENTFRHSFFLDVLQWHHAIATQEETVLFLEVAIQLWSVPECSFAEAVKYSNDSMLHVIVPVIGTEQDNTSSSSFHHAQQSTPQALDRSTVRRFMSATNLGQPEPLSLRDALYKGQVISVCARFLDDFEYSQIYTRDAVETNQLSWKPEVPLETTQTLQNTQHMQTCIIDRLLECDRLASFHDPVNKAQFDLQRRLLRNPREVEVQLVVDGRSMNQTESAYNEYQARVRSLCDEAMLPSSSFRDRCYATDLDEVLLFSEFQKKHSFVNTLVEAKNYYDGKISMDEKQQESLIFTESNQNSMSPYYSPATILTSATFLDSPGSSNNNSATMLTPSSTFSSSPFEGSSNLNSTTTLTPTSTFSSSPVESSSSTSKAGSKCPHCNKVFHGKDQDQKSNLTRHISTIHMSQPVPCPEPGCDMVFTRPDNIPRHRRNCHGR